MYCPKCKTKVFSITKDGVDILKELGYGDVKNRTARIFCPDCGTRLKEKNV